MIFSISVPFVNSSISVNLNTKSTLFLSREKSSDTLGMKDWCKLMAVMLL